MHIDRDQWSAYLRQYSLHYLVIALSAVLGACKFEISER